MKRITASNYRKDPLYQGIVTAVSRILDRGDEVAPIEVLVVLGRLRRKDIEDWRAGRIPYLERAIGGSLPKLSRLLRILRLHLEHARLSPRVVTYRRHRGRHAPLRFTKSGDRALEEAYSRHFRLPGRGRRPTPASPSARSGVDGEASP